MIVNAISTVENSLNNGDDESVSNDDDAKTFSNKK